MAKKTFNIIGDSTVAIGTATRAGAVEQYKATVFATGTFGAGTITFLASPDGGTTKVPIRDESGVIISLVADDMVNLNVGFAADEANAILIYAQMTGSTTPTVAVNVFDNK